MRAKTLKKGILPLILCVALLFSANALLGCSVDVPSEDKKEEVKLPEESDNKKDNREDNKKDDKKDNTVAMEKNEPKKPKTQEQQENVSVKDNQKPNSQQTEMAERAEEQNRSYRREEVVENEVVENEIAENEAFAENEEREGIAEVPEHEAENEEYYVAERPVELYEGN